MKAKHFVLILASLVLTTATFAGTNRARSHSVNRFVDGGVAALPRGSVLPIRVERPARVARLAP